MLFVSPLLFYYLYSKVRWRRRSRKIPIVHLGDPEDARVGRVALVGGLPEAQLGGGDLRERHRGAGDLGPGIGDGRHGLERGAIPRLDLDLLGGHVLLLEGVGRPMDGRGAQGLGLREGQLNPVRVRAFGRGPCGGRAAGGVNHLIIDGGCGVARERAVNGH